jgi:hypothetical protein
MLGALKRPPSLDKLAVYLAELAHLRCLGSAHCRPAIPGPARTFLIKLYDFAGHGESGASQGRNSVSTYKNRPCQSGNFYHRLSQFYQISTTGVKENFPSVPTDRKFDTFRPILFRIKCNKNPRRWTYLIPAELPHERIWYSMPFDREDWAQRTCT